MFKNLRQIRPLTLFGALITALALAGCTHSVRVDGTFPAPVGKTHPMTVGLYFSPDFRNFTYVDNSEDREDWNINTGKAQYNLFNTVLGSMFDSSVQLAQYPASVPGNVDIVIVPEVRELQFTMPRETRVNIFEVWIKYDMHAYNAQGESVADWVITAYGKTPTAFLKSEEDALAQAINIALRDAGATLYLGFNRVPELQAFLAAPRRAVSLRDEASENEGEVQ